MTATATAPTVEPLGADAVNAIYLDRARALVPTLREREDRCNGQRYVPHETIQDLKRAGFFRLLRPARFGGIDPEYDLYLQVTEELAQGCGSTAWVYGVLVIHDWFMKLWPAEIQEELWVGNPDILISSSLQPYPVTRVPGGYRLTGDWPFASGCDHADWAMVGGVAEGVSPRLMLVPLGSAEIVDNWHTLGLRGTGSKVLRFTDVFVPEAFAIEHRRVFHIELRVQGRPTGSVWYDTPVFAPGELFACVIAGLARRALGIVTETLSTKMSRGVKMADVELYQLRVGEAAANIDLARFALLEGNRPLIQRLRAGELVSPEEGLRRSRDVAILVRRLRDAIDQLSLCHSSWIYDRDPFQRIHRDAFTAATHFSARWENFVLPGGKTLIERARPTIQ